MNINGIDFRLLLNRQILGAHRASSLAVCLLIAGCSTLLTGCGTLIASSANQVSVNETIDSDSSQSTQAFEEEKDELEPPNQELTAELLEQLMIVNFASYAGDWNSAMLSSLSAAKISQDFRLARMAAVLALRSRSYQEVALASELWFELDEDNVDAYNSLMVGLVGSGDVASAMTRLDEALAKLEQSQSQAEQEPSSQESSNIELKPDVYEPNEAIDQHIRQVSGLLVRQNNADSAIEISNEYVSRYPDSAQVLLSASYVASYFDRTEQAEQWLTKSLALQPNWDVAAQMYSNMLARQDKDAERMAYIRLYLKDNPKSVSMRIQYAVELAREEEFQAGLDVMQQVVIDDPDNVDAIVYTAAVAQQLEQDELSQELYEQALALEPDNENVLWSLASFAIRDKDYLTAEDYYSRIGQGENYFRAQLQVANMRYETNGLNSALNALRRLQPRTEGEFVEIALSRHYLLMQENKYEEAFGYINDSLVYLPESDDLVYARALVAAELKEIEIAERDFRAIIGRNPEHANALNALGYTLADQTERYTEAKDLILKALELRPKEGHILDSLGWVLYRLEDYEGAISYLQQAFDVLPEAEVAAHLGEVYWEHGQQEQARNIWQQGYELDASNTVLIETLERFGQLEILANIESN